MRALWVAAVVVVVDQLTKVAVVQSMYRSQSIPIIGDWLKLTYTENPGMAFGITFGPRGFITLLALCATLLIGAYLYHLRDRFPPYRYSLALILGGAVGNIIDRVFYGVIYDYGTLFVGRVVDFIHVDLWRGTLQELLPFIGGAPRPIALFPIWNVADMAIVVGVVGILSFQRRFHQEEMAIVRRRQAERQQQAEAAAGAPAVSSEGSQEPPAASEQRTTVPYTETNGSTSSAE